MEGRQELGQPIGFGSYTICNRRSGVLKSAVHGMSQANVDLGIFYEMKFMARVGLGVGGTQASRSGIGSWRWRRQAHITAALWYSTARWGTSPWGVSVYMAQMSPTSRWLWDGNGVISWGVTSPLTNP